MFNQNAAKSGYFGGAWLQGDKPVVGFERPDPSSRVRRAAAPSLPMTPEEPVGAWVPDSATKRVIFDTAAGAEGKRQLGARRV